MLLFPLLLFSQSNNNEIIRGYIYNSEDNTPIQNANIHMYFDNGKIELISNKKGCFETTDITGKPVEKITISYVGFESISVQNPDNFIFFLKEKTEKLKEVVVKSKKNKKGFIESLLPYEHNLGFNQIAVSYISFQEENQNKVIAKLKYNVIDIGGVKGLRFLPFKVNLFSKDTLTGLPHKKIFESDLLTKKSNQDKWVEIDVSQYNITVPKEGIYIAFIVLDRSEYKIEQIQSEFGIIDAVPSLKLERTNDSKRKSYVFHSGYYEPKKQKDVWEKLPAVFEMEIEYNKKKTKSVIIL